MASKYRDQIMGRVETSSRLENAKDEVGMDNYLPMETRKVEIAVKTRREKRLSYKILSAVEVVIFIILACLAFLTVYSIINPQFGIEQLMRIQDAGKLQYPVIPINPI